MAGPGQEQDGVEEFELLVVLYCQMTATAQFAHFVPPCRLPWRWESIQTKNRGMT
jgi:hypothetical protein